MKLNERQKLVYELILKNSSENKITTQHEIYSAYPAEQFPNGYAWSDNENSHDHCSAIWSDIETINKSEEIDKLIITNNFTYYIATNPEEALEFAKKYMYSACRKLERYWNIVRKVKHDGQGKIDFIKSATTEFIDTYGTNNNQR